MNKKFDIVAVGGINIDLVLTMDHLPTHDEKVPAKFLGRFPGGPVGNFACAAGNFGARVASLCTVGNDTAGSMVIQDFERFGVDVSQIQVRDDYETPFTVIEIDPSGERAIVVPHFMDLVDPQQVIDLLPETRAIYTMPHDVDQFLIIAKEAKKCGVEVMIDIEPTLGFSKTQLFQILSVTGVASFNQPGFETITGKALTLESARALLDFGPHTIVGTLGARGSLAVNDSDEAQIPGFPVPVLDTTGAGDTFNAGFLTTTLSDLPLRDRLLFANAGSAMAIGCLGSRGCLPSRLDVIIFLAQAGIHLVCSS